MTELSAEQTPIVRVFVPTYRRSRLLARALDSLRAQTMLRWVCDIHNDDPSDSGPQELVQHLDDPRIRLIVHQANLGATATFNLFYRATAEPYYALLEDDNWWAPTFLEQMLKAMEQYPSVTLAWSNQCVWTEREDGTWEDSGRCVNPRDDSASARLVPWGDPRTALGAIHSHGSMLVRSRAGESFVTPPIPATGVEAFRERLIAHPLLYVPEALGYFAVTRVTVRLGEQASWMALQAGLLISYAEKCCSNQADFEKLWRYYSVQRPAPADIFLIAALWSKECRRFLACLGIVDIVRSLAGMARHPIRSARMFATMTTTRGWRDVLNDATARRQLESVY